MKNLFFLLAVLSLIVFSSCSSTQTTSGSSSSMTIAFGSCNHHYSVEQPIWKEVVKNSPDLWIWLGDIIYADTEDMTLMKDAYDTQKAHVDYNVLRAATDIIGVWDDHDYGANNSDKYYPKKDSSKLLLFDFLDVPKDDPAWERKGAYQSYEYVEGLLTVKVLLLDVRYFRDSLGTSQSTILGPAQWQWLIAELDGSTADVHIIGSGSQVLPEEHPFEKWADYPVDRQRLMQILNLLNVSNPIIISGDRHIAEMSLDTLPQSGKPILEITSSGLTHSYTDFTEETNKHRISPVFPVKNFGVLRIEKKGGNVYYDAEIRNELNKVQYSIKNNQLTATLRKLKQGK